MPDFLDAGTAPVYVGFGSMSLRAGTDFSGRRSKRSGPKAGRDDCFVVGEINHQELFRRVAAVVHHGGPGTTTTTAAAGAPQVVVLQGADQVYWAGRVVGMGVGTAYDGPSLNVEALSAAIEATLAPETRARAGTLAGKVRTDGSRVAARPLLDAIG